MNGYERLSLLLGKIAETQNKLLELENAKTDILIRGTAQELDEILIQEQPLIMNTISLEQRREALQNELGIAGIALKDLAQNHDPEDVYNFNSRLNELSQVLIRLKKTNNLNMAILNSRLSMLDQIMAISGLKEHTLTYGKPEQSKAEANRG